MTYRLLLTTVLLGGLAFSNAALAQTSSGGASESGTKVSPLPGSSGSSTHPSPADPSNTAGGSTPGTGSKTEALPPPDTSTPGTGNATTPVPAPTGTSGSSGTGTSPQGTSK